MVLTPISDSKPLQSIAFQFVTIGLILLCVAVFFWQLANGLDNPLIAFRLGLIPAVLFGQAELPPSIAVVPSWTTLVTSIFLHGGWLHLFGNMLFLWVFGDNVEDSMGHVRYLGFFLLCGIAAALTHAAMAPGLQVPLIGASGSISGVLGAYLVLHPRSRLLVLAMNIFPLRLPAFVVLVTWIALQFFNLDRSAETGVAWGAHIGGFLAGALLIIPFRRKGVPLFDGIGGFPPPDPVVIEREERRHARSIFPNTVGPEAARRDDSRRPVPWGRRPD